MSAEQLILNQDCAELIGLEFDSLITDPPYSEFVHKNATSNSPGKGVRKRDLGFSHLSNELRDAIHQHADKARKWSVIFTDVEGAHLWRQGYRKPHRYIRTVPWIRWSMPQLSADRPPQVFEEIVLGHHKSRPKFNGPGNFDYGLYFEEKCLRGADKHKAEKPLDLCLRLVSYFSDEGDLVFDPCAGSGTFGLACKLLGRNYVGCEIDPRWFMFAQTRMKGALTNRDAERLARWEASQSEPG
jgi:site-specific DNA-methyltransferase (adenine-specific)